jgi:hypothetical protein
MGLLWKVFTTMTMGLAKAWDEIPYCLSEMHPPAVLLFSRSVLACNEAQERDCLHACVFDIHWEPRSDWRLSETAASWNRTPTGREAAYDEIIYIYRCILCIDMQYQLFYITSGASRLFLSLRAYNSSVKNSAIHSLVGYESLSRCR